DKGVIERSLDEDDRRRVIVTLSERGREVFEAIESVRAALEENMLAPLSPEEVDNLFKILDKLDERAKSRFSSPQAWRQYYEPDFEKNHMPGNLQLEDKS